MESKIWLPAITAVLSLVVTSGDALKCYECKSTSAADDDCSSEMLKNLPHSTIECSLESMTAFHNRLSLDSTLFNIANVFEVYTGSEVHHQHRDLHTPLACLKMKLRVGNQPVLVRTCQTAKMAEVDPCKAMQDKIANSYHSTSVTSCDLCETDKCNGSYSLTPVTIMAIVPLISSILINLMGFNNAA